jgi:hypothetical protein
MALLSPSLRGVTALLVTLAYAGCGDGVIDNQYRGPSLWQYGGGTSRSGSEADGDDPLRVAMFWNPQGEIGTDPTRYVEMLASASSTRVGDPFLLNLYEYPAAEHFARTASGLSRGFAVGRILVYIDRDRDGRYSAVDQFTGVLPNVAFLYVPAFLPAWASPTGLALSAGFFSVMLPQRCDVVVPTGTDAGTCGVMLGTSCMRDSGCGSGGVCLRETDVPWPTGYCAIEDSATTTCRPKDSSYYGVPKFGLTPNGVSGYYLQSCQNDMDCGKTGVREVGLYHCDPGLLACAPSPGGKLPVGAPFHIEPFCIGGS